MTPSSTEPSLEEFWKDVRPERLPPADLSPCKELLDLINMSVRYREMILEEYLATKSGRETVFLGYTKHLNDDHQSSESRLHLAILTRFLLHCDGTEALNFKALKKLITNLRQVDSTDLLYVSASYRGQELKYDLGFVTVPVFNPRPLRSGEMHELMDPQDIVPISGLFYIIEGHFFPRFSCVLDQLNLYNSSESSARPIASKSVGVTELAPPLGIQFKFALTSLVT